MLPGNTSSLRHLDEVLRASLDSVCGRENALGLPGVRHAIVVLVDGLGVANLRARSGHARHLAARMTSKARAFSGFPSTTASALASLTTGAASGEHGMVGYALRNPATGAIANQLNGWGPDLDPATWQRRQTLFETAAREGIPSFAVGPARYADSGFTHAVLRGAEYLSGKSVEARFDVLLEILAATAGPAVAYLYVPELDTAGHSVGSESTAWTAALEELDAEVGRAVARLAPDQGMLLTADHGMVDVPASAHILYDTAPQLIEGVDVVGGEPRCLQLYARPGAADDLRAAWLESESDRAWVVSRDEAIEGEWFGPRVDDEVRARIGDVLVAARKRVAYYHSTVTTGRSMIGQHGSWTDEETIVPLLRFGAFQD